MDLDEMLRVDRCRNMDELLNPIPIIVRMPEPDCFLRRPPLSYKLSYAEFYVGKIPRIGAARRCSDAWF